ncbi:sulfotransferase family protein [Rubrobacter marinus]|uniref:sulfotransferase family protein n=1 Tax=Rubrobacter marinus TaxID=2653852 RepID=UPI001409D966|nr:sulfotransferase family protein [Rubrobacter marinus]
MGLEVIGAGFGRTGTTSLKVALEELGFGPCYHMTELFEHPEHLEAWRAAVRGEPVDWEGPLKGYRSTLDWPGAPFYEDLMREYPEARVILTVRDPDRWYESTLNTIYEMNSTASSPLFKITSWIVPRVRNVRRAVGIVDDLAWRETFGGRFEDREHAISVFNEWNEGVKRRVPAEKLLVYDVKEGWGPLCEFLGVEAPEDEPFPHLNDTEIFRRRVRIILSLAAAGLIGGASLAVLGSILVLRRRP